MKTLIRSVLAPLISLLIIMLGNSFFSTFVNISLAERSPCWVLGLLTSAYYAGILIASLKMESLIRKISHIRAFAIFASINAMIVMLQSIISDPISCIIFRFIGGLCAGSYFIIIESWLLLLSDVKTRGKLLSLYMLTVYAGQGLGQFILNISDIHTLFPFCLTVSLCSLAVIPICLITTPSPILPESSHIKISQVFKSAPLGFIGCILSGMIISVFYGLGPLFGTQNGFTIGQVSQMMGLTILGGLSLQWPIGYLSDIFDRRKVLCVVALVIIMISTVLIFTAKFPFFLFLIISVLFGGFAFTLYPLSINYTADRVSSTSITTIVCVMLVLFGVGSIIGPMIAPFAFTLFGPKGFHYYIIALTALLYILGRSPLGKHKVPQDEAFIAFPSTSRQAAHLVPPQEEEPSTPEVAPAEASVNPPE